MGKKFPYYWGFELESLLIDFDHGLKLAMHAILTGVLDVSSRCRLSSLSHSRSQERLQAIKLCNSKMSYRAGWWQGWLNSLSPNVLPFPLGTFSSNLFPSVSCTLDKRKPFSLRESPPPGMSASSGWWYLEPRGSKGASAQAAGSARSPSPSPGCQGAVTPYSPHR